MPESHVFTTLAFIPFEAPLADGAIGQVIAFGANVPITSSALLARIGDLKVRDVVVAPGGSGFAGTVDQLPSEGEELFVTICGVEEGTDVIFETGGLV